MKHSCKLLVLMLLFLLPAKASALYCAMISIAESCDMRWDRHSGVDGRFAVKPISFWQKELSLALFGEGFRSTFFYRLK